MAARGAARGAHTVPAVPIERGMRGAVRSLPGMRDGHLQRGGPQHDRHVSAVRRDAETVVKGWGSVIIAHLQTQARGMSFPSVGTPRGAPSCLVLGEPRVQHQLSRLMRRDCPLSIAASAPSPSPNALSHLARKVGS